MQCSTATVGVRSESVGGDRIWSLVLESDLHLHPLSVHPANDLALEVFQLTDYRVDDRLVC